MHTSFAQINTYVLKFYSTHLQLLYIWMQMPMTNLIYQKKSGKSTQCQNYLEGNNIKLYMNFTLFTLGYPVRAELCSPQGPSIHQQHTN